MVIEWKTGLLVFAIVFCNTFNKKKEIGGYYGSRTKDNVAS